jgi:PPP family 3-phenylpropionic acid transporter
MTVRSSPEAVGLPARKVRLAFFYAAFFTVIGIQLPFWPVWLAWKGMSPAEIGVLVALGVAAKVAGNPLAGHLADRMGERRRPMVAFAGCALVAFALFGLADGFWPIFAVTLLFFMLLPPVMPLGESLTMLAARDGALDYGRIRLWGSISFIVLAVVAGRVLVDEPPDVVYWMVLGAVALTAFSCLLLPDVRPDVRPERAGSMVMSFLGPLRDRSFVLFLAAAAMIQGSHAVYYAFGTLHWQAAGYSDDVIGALWAEGVVAEIVLFAFGGPLVRRLGPARLIALGGIAGTVRWLVLGHTDALPALICAQTLHAFTFGAAHLGAIHFIARAVPPTLSATAQSLYSAVVMGLGTGLMLLASGSLYAALAGAAYLPMAAAALIGGLLAWMLARQRPAEG